MRALVGLCQGGWPGSRLCGALSGQGRGFVPAGAPIDIEAAPSEIARSIATVTPSAIRILLAMSGGLVLGHLSLPFWSEVLHHEFDPKSVLQVDCDRDLAAQVVAWNKVTLDLARNSFPADRRLDLSGKSSRPRRLPALGRLVPWPP